MGRGEDDAWTADQVRVVAGGSGATERGRHRLLPRGRRESGHEHQGKRTTGGSEKGKKKRRERERNVGVGRRDTGGRTDGGEDVEWRTHDRAEGRERDRVVHPSPSRVEKDLRANFPRSPNLILIPPQRTPSFWREEGGGVGVGRRRGRPGAGWFAGV